MLDRKSGPFTIKLQNFVYRPKELFCLFATDMVLGQLAFRLLLRRRVGRSLRRLLRRLLWLWRLGQTAGQHEKKCNKCAKRFHSLQGCHMAADCVIPCLE
jgi:hypothetical protein